MAPGYKFFIQTYGCQMNVYDSAVISTLMEQAGFQPVKTEEEADILIYNTCAVREHAENRAMGRILSAKGRYPLRKIVVVGCMAERRKSELKEKYGIKYVFGPREYKNIPGVLINQEAHYINLNYDDILPEQEGVSAYVSVMRGCNRFCTYCIVPYVRKEEVCRQPENIIDEVKKLIKDGIKEVILLGQNVNRYKYRDINFPELLKWVAEETDIKRLNFLTSHPADISSELFEVMVGHNNITKFIHLPVQSGSDKILNKMNRGYTVRDYKNIVKFARGLIPEITITTDVIVGFPGETDEDFQKTLDFIKEIEFDYAFMFKYSPRKGTLSALFDETITEREKKERLSKLIELQNKITYKKNERLIGRERKILVLGTAKRDGVMGKDATGKLVVFKGDSKRGSFVKINITGITGWTPVGKVVKSVNREM